MNRIILSFILIMILGSVFIIGLSKKSENSNVRTDDVSVVLLNSSNIQELTKKEIYEVRLNKFLKELADSIGYFESNNNYLAVNRFGYLGRYQFSPRTIRHLGYDVSREEFLSDPILQDQIMYDYMLDNLNSLIEYIDEYGYTVFKGNYITMSSIIAGAHFAGSHGVKRFLDNPNDHIGTVDSNGTTLINYMNKFSGIENTEGI